jgi:hypothetical protein
MNAPGEENVSSGAVSAYQHEQDTANQAVIAHIQSIQESPAAFSPSTISSVPNIQIAGNGLLAPTSVNQYEEIPTIPNMDYGFKPGHGLEQNTSFQGNGYGVYANYVLPTVSTGPVNINTVDCPFIGANQGRNSHWIYTGKKRGWVDLQETAPGSSVPQPVVPVSPINWTPPVQL